MTRDTRIALFLLGELVAALRANDPDAFRDLLSEGIEELGVKELGVKELKVLPAGELVLHCVIFCMLMTLVKPAFLF